MTQEMSSDPITETKIEPLVARRVRPIGVERSSSEYCESMGSWLLRTAIANGFAKLSDLMQKTGYYNVHLDIPLRPQKYIPALSAATGRPRHEIEPMLLSINKKGNIVERDFSARSWLLSAWRPQSPTRDGMRHVVCPLCLYEDPVPYWRKYWRFSFTTTCLVHHTPMSEFCRHCSNPFCIDAWDCFSLDMCSACGQPLSTATPNLAKLKPARLERMLSSVFSTGGSSAFVGAAPSRSLRLNLQRLVEFLCTPEGLMYRAAPGEAKWPNDAKPFTMRALMTRFPQLPVAERRAVIEFVELMARHSPVALWQLLNIDCSQGTKNWMALAEMLLFQSPRPIRWSRSSGSRGNRLRLSHALVKA